MCRFLLFSDIENNGCVREYVFLGGGYEVYKGF